MRIIHDTHDGIRVAIDTWTRTAWIAGYPHLPIDYYDRGEYADPSVVASNGRLSRDGDSVAEAAVNVFNARRKAMKKAMRI